MKFNPRSLKDRMKVDFLSPLVMDISQYYTDAIMYLHEEIDNGYDEKFGARPLKRAIQKFVEDPLAEEIIKSNFKEGEKIKLDLNSAKDGLDVIHQKESKPKKPSTKKKDE